MFFEEKSLIFQEIIDLISGVDIIISAAWGQISACFKNLTPWFCSLENPGFCHQSCSSRNEIILSMDEKMLSMDDKNFVYG